jgi:hypothetical protein
MAGFTLQLVSFWRNCCSHLGNVLWASDLRRTTPTAFRTPLEEVDQWATTASDMLSNNRTTSGVSPAPGAVSPDDDDDDFDSARAALADTDGLPVTSEDRSGQRLSGGSKKGSSTLMDRFRRLSTHLQGRFRSKSDEPGDDSLLNRSVYESKNSETICMWVEASEVVPCLCSNRRRPADIVSVCDEFVTGVRASQGTKTSGSVADNKKGRGSDGVCNPEPDAGFSHRQPFYFGLDCRPAEERVIGRFPKVCFASSHLFAFRDVAVVGVCYRSVLYF